MKECAILTPLKFFRILRTRKLPLNRPWNWIELKPEQWINAPRRVSWGSCNVSAYSHLREHLSERYFHGYFPQKALNVAPSSFHPNNHWKLSGFKFYSNSTIFVNLFNIKILPFGFFSPLHEQIILFPLVMWVQRKPFLKENKNLCEYIFLQCGRVLMIHKSSWREETTKNHKIHPKRKKEDLICKLRDLLDQCNWNICINNLHESTQKKFYKMTQYYGISQQERMGRDLGKAIFGTNSSHASRQNWSQKIINTL